MAPEFALGIGLASESYIRRDVLKDRHELLRMHSYGVVFAGMALLATLLPFFFGVDFGKAWALHSKSVL